MARSIMAWQRAERLRIDLSEAQKHEDQQRQGRSNASLRTSKAQAGQGTARGAVGTDAATSGRRVGTAVRTKVAGSARS
jgi:hypothetical protein